MVVDAKVDKDMGMGMHAGEVMDVVVYGEYGVMVLGYELP